MKLKFRKHNVQNLKQLEALVTEHAEAIEPGCRILAAGVNLGRSTVDLAGVDARRTPVLVALGLTADDEMLFRMLEAYAWCLEYPESVRRVVGDERGGWPPRVVFIAERVLEAFVRKLKLLKLPAVDCFEFRCVDVDDATGFYLDPVDRDRVPAASHDAVPAPRALRLHETLASAEPAVSRAEPVASRAPERPKEKREERREPVALPVDFKSLLGGGGQTPRWLELLTTPPEPSAVAPAPVPEPTVAPAEPPRRPVAGPEPPRQADAARPKQPDLLEGVELPANRELTPTWRKFLDKLTAGFDALAAPEPEPAPAPPADREVAAPMAFAQLARGRNGAGDKRGLLEGVQLPANGELAPQWRKFLDRPLIEEGKIRAVKDYLHREFPLCTSYDFFEFQRNAHVFQLQDNQGKVAHITTLTAEFFEQQHETEIRVWLEKHRLAQTMRQAGQAGVLVSPAGLQVEKR